MTKFSANLGFLWTEISLTDGIQEAKKAGFDAVECHWPFHISTHDMRGALETADLQMIGLNTVRGQVGENGLATLKGRESEARQAIDQAIDYAAAIGANNVHVMAGFASGKSAHDTFADNLKYASAQAAKHGVTVLIEPLNHYDAPGYFLSHSDQAAALIDELDLANVKMMFDCYHIQIMEGDLTRRLENLLPYIGHIQIASVPDRQEPDHGEINYDHIYRHLDALGYQGFIGAEYRPKATVEEGLGWLAKAKALNV